MQLHLQVMQITPQIAEVSQVLTLEFVQFLAHARALLTNSGGNIFAKINDAPRHAAKPYNYGADSALDAATVTSCTMTLPLLECQHGSPVNGQQQARYSSSKRTASLNGGERPADALQRLALRRDAEARRD